MYFRSMAYLDQYLFVKPSTLPGAGFGLFTRVPINKGTRITEYKGRLVRWAEVRHLDGVNGYLLRVHRSWAIDARHRTHTWGRYANDAKGSVRRLGMRNNAEYVAEGLRCYLDAIRPITAGEEILVGYGAEYWQLMRSLTRQKDC